MELMIAGGVGEHGRNCFLVQDETLRFLVDCGKMADTPEDPFPRLNREQIRSLDAVFLTHSHADHTGALPWLYENGFQGIVIAAAETLRQLPFALPESRALETLCPAGAGRFRHLDIQWGRSGHCAGSVWYHFTGNSTSIFFSGDYTEDTLVYACDPIRNRRADLAVLDCAYGPDKTPCQVYCHQLIQQAKELLDQHQLLLFPVPKYGRGMEILKLFTDCLTGVSYYADALFRANLAELNSGGFWYKSAKIDAAVQAYNGEARGIVFVSDPQLRSEAARRSAEQILSLDAMAVMTGTLEKNGFSERLFRQGWAKMLRYPVHLNHAQFERLNGENSFRQTIPYHSREISVNWGTSD